MTRARWRTIAAWLWVVPLLLASKSAAAGSLRFVANAPTQYDFVDITRLPASFGRGEFALEMWIKPDNSFPVGPVWRAGYKPTSWFA